MHDTLPLLRVTAFPPLRRRSLATLQVNLGYRCNQSCVHCHVNAGPERTERMDGATIELIPQVLAARGLQTLDLTGGAPELHPRFRALVAAVRALGVTVIDRWVVFQTWISTPKTDYKVLIKKAVEKPLSTSRTLPRLYTLTNMPILRFGSTLVSKGQFGDYMRLLKDNSCPGNLEQVMCRDLISVDWQGYLYDCDFNQQLRLPLHGKGWSGGRRHLSDLLGEDFAGASIAVADHGYGCAAGQGSSCGGALSETQRERAA